jgi:hypothetical protein
MLPNMKGYQPLNHEFQTLFHFNNGSTINKNMSSCIAWSLQLGKRAKTYLLDRCDKLFTYASSISAMVELANWQNITLIPAAEAQRSLNKSTDFNTSQKTNLTTLCPIHLYELEVTWSKWSFRTDSQHCFPRQNWGTLCKLKTSLQRTTWATSASKAL